MVNALASASGRVAWREPRPCIAQPGPEFAGVPLATDPAREPWAAAVGTAALSAPATAARVRVPRGTPLV